MPQTLTKDLYPPINKTTITVPDTKTRLIRLIANHLAEIQLRDDQIGFPIDYSFDCENMDDFSNYLLFEVLEYLKNEKI